MGVSAQLGVSALGVVCLGGVSIPAYNGADPKPPPPNMWTEFLLHASENISFTPLLLQTVKMIHYYIPGIKLIKFHVESRTYPESNATCFSCALWNLKQQLT